MKSLGIAVVAGLVLAATSCTDYSDYNSVPEDSNNAMAGKTLYENIVANEQLQGVAAAIHKAGYEKVLNSPQSYTFWAPLDGTYDINSILAQDSATIVDRFLKMHMAQYKYPVSGDVDTRVITLNDKHHLFTNTMFDNLDVEDINIPSSNGLMHTIKGVSQYYPNLYENLTEVAGSDSLVKFIKSYDMSYIDERASIKGPMVNGQQTYLDTVWATTNPVISNILHADIEDEDSSYVMLMPTNEAWRNITATMQPNFNFITGFNYMDITTVQTAAASIKAGIATSTYKVDIDPVQYTDSIIKYFITRNLVYSLTYKRNEPLVTNSLVGTATNPDSLYSTTGALLSNVSEILGHCGPVQKLSNGYTRLFDSLCFKPYQTYQPVLRTSRPIRTLGLKANAKVSTYSILQRDLLPSRDTLFSELTPYLKSVVVPKESNYITYICTDSSDFNNASSKVELDFALTDVRSQKYKMYIVFSPFTTATTGEPHICNKPLYLRFDMAYNKADGSVAYERINVPGAKKATDDIIIPANGKFNYVELDFTFPISYYGLRYVENQENKRIYPTLFISHTKAFTSSANRRNYDQELRIQGIYLVPVEAEDYVNNYVY